MLQKGCKIVTIVCKKRLKMPISQWSDTKKSLPNVTTPTLGTQSKQEVCRYILEICQLKSQLPI